MDSKKPKSDKHDDKQLEMSINSSKSSLPEEILETIFFHLSCPRDYMRVSNACQQFKRILKPKIPVWSFEEVFPLIFKDLDKDTILNCRLVCRDWNKVVDKFAERHPISRCYEPYTYNPTKKVHDGLPIETSDLVPARYSPKYEPSLLQKNFACTTSFSDATAVPRFIEKFGASHSAVKRNPIFLRYLDLANNQLDEQNGPEVYWNQVDKLLSQYGHNLTRVHLGPSTNDADRQFARFGYMAIRDSLLKLKNLRTLTIGGLDCQTPWQPEDAEIFTDLERYIQSHPLPELPYLNTMEVSIPINYKTNPVNQALYKRYAQQLNKVYMTLSLWSQEKNEIFDFANLIELFVGVDEDFNVLAKFMEMVHAPVLRKLFLVTHERVRITPLLMLIKSHFQKLEYLKLRFNCSPIITYMPLQLENIKTLELDDNLMTPYKELLRHVPKLEYLLVTTRTSTLENLDYWWDLSAAQNWEFRNDMYSGKIYNLKVWEEIKSLREFTFATMGPGNLMTEIVTKKRYKRELYEYWKAN